MEQPVGVAEMYGVALVAVVLLLALARSVRVANEWSRAVVLRLGRFAGVRGPGLYFLIPLIDRVAMTIDLRIQTTSITAEQALTRDTVAVGVDAIVFWQVEDPRRAALQIADYRQAIERVAQTSLREMIGASDLSRLLSDTQAADDQLRQTIGGKTGDWGVMVRSVEIRDVSIPPELQDAMSRQAQAERERHARVTLASAEADIAAQVVAAAAIYATDPIAFQLRQMNLLYEMNKDRGATILLPTEMAGALGRVLMQTTTPSADPGRGPAGGASG
jgi:regulator of protease activity HflC (stomatin/prohibitin superfamily)